MRGRLAFATNGCISKHVGIDFRGAVAPAHLLRIDINVLKRSGEHAVLGFCEWPLPRDTNGLNFPDRSGAFIDHLCRSLVG